MEKVSLLKTLIMSSIMIALVVGKTNMETITIKMDLLIKNLIQRAKKASARAHGVMKKINLNNNSGLALMYKKSSRNNHFNHKYN
jgi:hypothetical protein